MSNERNRLLQAALVHQRAGRFSEAEKAYKRVLKRAPDDFDCAYLLGMHYAGQGNLRAAIDMFRRAAKSRPDIPDVHYNLAVALGLAGRHDEAAFAYRQILDLDPRHADAHNNYAATLLQIGRFGEALQQYDKLIALNPNVADAYNNRGMAFEQSRRPSDALNDYDKAIALRPNFPEAYANRGNVLTALGRSEDALASYNKAVALRPDFADACANVANLYSARRSYGDAIDAYDRVLALRPDDADARCMRLYAKMQLCDWSDYEVETSALLSAIGNGVPAYPFVVLAMPSSLDDQLRCARLFIERRYPPSDKPLWRGEIYSHDRIRVAYVSSDLREHAVGYQTVGLFEHHDRSRFEVVAIALSASHDTEFGRRMKASFESFVETGSRSDEEIAGLIREREIDIVVDLNGFTQNWRPGIFARRPAPIQVNYLGYSGTTGAPYFDYILADRTIVPAEKFPFYSEKVVWLPDSFMASDDGRPIGDRTPARSELSLPETGFVFCCFNQSYKLNPTMFDVWMRLLAAIDGSVLWLKDNDAAATHNLRLEAERRGIAAQRLVFAPPVPLVADHLARHRKADLFLDTLPYNAHTTTNDALWAGLPVLSCLGPTFAARVAASQLNTVGLPELITTSLAEYEALALRLAREPALLGAAKAKLAANRRALPLFDTARFARNIEAAYTAMRQLYRQGRHPMHVAVSVDDRPARSGR
jgi:predicted O-linked N-acetylglucosamine transferase (SPINDLY family)